MSEETAAGPALRRLPLRDRHLAAGARMAPFAGWEMPLQYRGIVAEHEAVRTAAGIFDVSHMGRVRVAGPSAGERIRAATTYDVTGVEPGRTHYSLYCNEQGGIDDDVVVFRLARDRWLVVHNAANAGSDYERLRRSAGEAADDLGASTAMLAVQGPQAPAAVERVLGPAFAQLEPRACVEVEWRGAPVTLSRTGYTGEDGGEVIATPDVAAALWDAFVEADVQPCGLGARDTLRLEAALPLHGQDITPDTTPYQAGIGWAVSLDDGRDFTGRAALARLAETPPATRLACLRLDGRGVPRAGYPVFEPGDGGRVATLTSGAYSPTLRTGIAMGYLPAGQAAPGTRFDIEVHGRRLPAEVVRRPFYRRRRGRDG